MSPLNLVPPPEPLLRAEHLTLAYRGERGIVRALVDVSFDVYQRDRCVLLGPSGCGKSTLLKAIGGFIAPQAGSLTLGGKAITRPGPDRIVVFQEFDQLPPWKTVRENVMFPMLSSGIKRKEADVRARRTMQEQLQALWIEAGFTMLFVTHSIEEALVVGNRILLLSPHPGRVRAELNSHQFTLANAGSGEFQAATQRIHDLLFGVQEPPEPAHPTGVVHA